MSAGDINKHKAIPPYIKTIKSGKIQIQHAQQLLFDNSYDMILA